MYLYHIQRLFMWNGQFRWDDYTKNKMYVKFQTDFVFCKRAPIVKQINLYVTIFIYTPLRYNGG